MSGACPRGGEGEQRVVAGGVRGEVPGGRGGCLSFYHVPQQCRREKLRFLNADERPCWQFPTLPPPPSLFHFDAPVSAPAPTSTASFTPSSSSLQLNPNYINAAVPYDHGTATIHFLDHHPLFGGANSHHGQGVSLSLSSAASPAHQNDQHHHGPTVCAPGQLPLASAVSRIRPVPVGPFTGYATILQVSRFLRPAQQLLEEVCGRGGTMVGALVCSGGDMEPLDLAAEGVGECAEIVDSLTSEGEDRRMQSRLISMLAEVCRRYKQYYQQIQAVIMSFEAVAGLNTAAPYTPLALRSLSKHFRCLKNAISDQLQFANKALGKAGQSTEGTPGYTVLNGGFCYERVPHGSGAINQQPVWRPQRGLPERAVSVLRAWLFEHFLHPYPTDMDKQMLAKQTGLSRNQVSNWFINARVRLWKPMVEEIHSLELQQANNVSGNDNRHDTKKHVQFSSTVSPTTEQTSPNINFQQIPGHPHKWFQDELSQQPTHMKEPLNFSLDNLCVHHRAGALTGFASGAAAANGGVSLTLGLHQNDGICLSEPLPLNVAQRFGFEESSVGYTMGGFEGHDRHFARELDGQLLHHFVA